MTSNTKNSVKADEYFKCCKKYVQLLECIRKNNFHLIKSGLVKRYSSNKNYQVFVKNLNLDDVKNKIDYDKACRKGIYCRKFLKDRDTSTDTIEVL